jgi:hypothetical protein
MVSRWDSSSDMGQSLSEWVREATGDEYNNMAALGAAVCWFFVA